MVERDFFIDPEPIPESLAVDGPAPNDDDVRDFGEYWARRLRAYQKAAIRQMRAYVRGGAKNVLICAPTGSGKTEIAACLVALNQKKGKRSAFVVDRKSLINQTSDTFDRHNIEHGIIQANNPRWRPGLPTQVCSVQTVQRRQWPEADLIIVDEAHTDSAVVKARISPRTNVSLGLTATPFTKGLGKTYDAVVNVTTTNALIAAGFLSKYRIFACAEPDMEGVKVVNGEFERHETEKRALQVVGDVVAEYLLHGHGRKFICSAVDTVHVLELQRQFLAAGVNVATYTYKDLDEDRDETVTEFRRADSSIRGLITVTAASKGFDVPDIGCVIMARPLRNSLAEHIQFFGRGLRIASGKDDCIILDHSGNCARFWDAWNHVFEHGVSVLDDGKKREKPKLEKKEDEGAMTCPQCKRVHMPQPSCPGCGFEYPKRKAVEHIAGSLKELLATGTPKQVSAALLPQIMGYASEKWPHDWMKKTKWLHFLVTGNWPAHGTIDAALAAPPTPELRGQIEHARIKDQKRRQADARREKAAARAASSMSGVFA